MNSGQNRNRVDSHLIGIVGALIGVAVIVGLVLVVTREMPPPKSPPEKRIVIGYTPFVLNLPVFVAKEKKLFGEYEVEIKKFTSTDTMLTALIRGDIDVSCSLGVEKVLAVNAEGDRPVASPFLFNSFSSDDWCEAFLISSEGENISSMADLDGKIIGTLPAETAVLYARLIAKKNGIRFSSVRKIPPDQALNTLMRGDIDALLAVEPQIAFGISTGKIRVLENAPVAKYVHDPLLIGAHVLNNDRVANDAQVAVAVHKAFSDAVKLISENPLDALASGRKYLPNLNDEVLKALNMPKWIVSGTEKNEDIDYVTKLFVDEGIVVEDYRALENDIYTP